MAAGRVIFSDRIILSYHFCNIDRVQAGRSDMVFCMAYRGYRVDAALYHSEAKKLVKQF